MSGICGICATGEQFEATELEPMFRGTRLPGEKSPAALSVMGAALGVSARWDYQSVGRRNGIVAAVSADLCNRAKLSADVREESNGGSFSSAELVAELYHRYGLELLEKMEGSFAVAIWDTNCQELVLAVDPLGLETLYWAEDRGRLLFSTRVGGILQAKPDCGLDPAAMMQFLLYTVVPAPMAIYRGVERLEAGTALVWRRGTASKKRYWDMHYQEVSTQKPAHWAHQLREQLRRAVHSHLNGCRPEQSGAYLSGGTDSSSVVAFGSELYSSFNAFSIYFENPQYDELA